MIVRSIPVDKINEFLEFTELKRELVTRLTILKEAKELELKRMQRIVTICKKLRFIKEKHRFKWDANPEIIKEIKKHARW